MAELKTGWELEIQDCEVPFVAHSEQSQRAAVAEIKRLRIVRDAVTKERDAAVARAKKAEEEVERLRRGLTLMSGADVVWAVGNLLAGRKWNEGESKSRRGHLTPGLERDTEGL